MFAKVAQLNLVNLGSIKHKKKFGIELRSGEGGGGGGERAGGGRFPENAVWHTFFNWR